MVKTNKQDMMGKVYREFSRQKYNKYKHQYPKMRESEIVSKIIREWDCLDHLAKENLQKQYEHHNALSPANESDSETLQKIENSKKIELQSTQRKEDKETPLRTPVQSEVKFQGVISQFKPSEPGSSKSMLASVKYFDQSPVRVEGKVRVNNSGYLTFFRFYYDKYSREHPNWGAKQISIIIRLLWKKRKYQNKKLVIGHAHKKITLKIPKEMSGRKLFRRFKKNLNGVQCKKIWNRLPFETKNMWQREARGGEKQENREVKVLLKGEGESGAKVDRVFGFLGKPMLA